MIGFRWHSQLTNGSSCENFFMIKLQFIKILQCKSLWSPENASSWILKEELINRKSRVTNRLILQLYLLLILRSVIWMLRKVNAYLVRMENQVMKTDKLMHSFTVDQALWIMEEVINVTYYLMKNHNTPLIEMTQLNWTLWHWEHHLLHKQSLNDKYIWFLCYKYLQRH